MTEPLPPLRKVTLDGCGGYRNRRCILGKGGRCLQCDRELVPALAHVTDRIAEIQARCAVRARNRALRTG